MKLIFIRNLAIAQLKNKKNLPMKKLVFSLLAVCACVLCFLASFGMFSNRNRMFMQNMLGGYGQINTVGNPRYHYYYDDTNFYYPAYITSWSNFDFTMFLYDLESGQCSRVCKRISCIHKTADCPIHPLFQSDIVQSTRGEWNMIDHQFIAASLTKDFMQINCWDPVSNSITKIIDIPRYMRVSDRKDLGGQYESFFNEAMRLTDDLVLIGYNNEMYICDNQYHERFRFSCRGLRFPLVTAHRLFWLGMQNELNCIDLETGEREDNILKDCFKTRRVVSIFDYNYPFAAFTYDDKVYFPYKGMIYAFDPQEHSVCSIVQIDKLTKDDPYACFINENLLYYKQQDIIHCMNLDTGSVTVLPDMPKVPSVSVRDLFLYIRPDVTGESDDIICFDRSGKLVHT